MRTKLKYEEVMSNRLVYLRASAHTQTNTTWSLSFLFFLLLYRIYMKKIYHLYISHIILQYSIILFIFIVGLSSTKNSLLLYTLHYCLVMYFVCTFLKAFHSHYIIFEHHSSVWHSDISFNDFDTLCNEYFMYKNNYSKYKISMLKK